ncbi:hypothetical protein [Bartonella sp. CB178]|uniref:hypothetical protein n=1 Tax=Bartonella sp. CB178 TaxID=3112255 RepID=UPI00300E4323
MKRYIGKKLKGCAAVRLQSLIWEEMLYLSFEIADSLFAPTDLIPVITRIKARIVTTTTSAFSADIFSSDHMSIIKRNGK